MDRRHLQRHPRLQLGQGRKSIRPGLECVGAHHEAGAREVERLTSRPASNEPSSEPAYVPLQPVHSSREGSMLTSQEIDMEPLCARPHNRSTIAEFVGEKSNGS